MSRPGDLGRRQVFAGDQVEAVAKAAELIGTIPGARSFELAYDARDRVLAEDEEPRPDEAVVWTATAVIRRKFGKRREDLTYVGEAVVEAGGNHSRGGALACVALLEKLGANTVVVDLTDDTDPRAEA